MGSGKTLPDLKQSSSFYLCLLSIPALYCTAHSLCPFIFFKHNHHDVLYLSHHQYFLHIKKTIWICMHLIACLSQEISHAYVLGERNKTVLINSLLRPRVLAALWSAELFQIMCVRKQISCKRTTALSSTPLLQLVSLYPAETQHLLWRESLLNNLSLYWHVLTWHHREK